MTIFWADQAAIQGFRKVMASALLATTALAAGAIIAPGTAHAQAAQSYDIPAGPLAVVLNRFAEASGIELFYDSSLTNGVSSPGLKGSFGPAEGLSRILTGTGLTFRQTGLGAFTLERAPQSADGAIQLGPVRVEGDDRSGNSAGYAYAGEETAASPVRGFVAHRSATATKTDTPLIETPQSVSIVTQDQIKAQAADSLDQAFAYTAGISSVFGGAQRNTVTAFNIRGFNANTGPLYLNGSKFPLAGFNGAMEPYAFERIELLKGPASILYGQAAPGGIINLVSKRPTAEPMGEIELQAGSWNRIQGAVDLGGPLGDDGKFGYRLTGLLRDSDAMISEIRNDRAMLSGAFDWHPTDRTSFTVFGTYNKTKAGYDAGRPLDGTILPNPNGNISRKLFVGEDSLNKSDAEGWTLGYLFEHRFSDAWAVRQNVLYYDYQNDYAYGATQQRVNQANPATVNRYAIARFDDDKGYSIDTQLQGKLHHGRFEHTLLFGLDWSDREYQRTQRFGSLASLNLYAPVYGATATFNAPVILPTNTRQLGIYAQDQIKFDGNLILLLGGRYDALRNDSGPGTTREKSDAFSPRVGLLYLFDNGLAPYYSFTRSFEPSSSVDVNGDRFKPTRGTQHEIGLKFEPTGSNLAITAAAYEITQQNVLTADLANPGFLTQEGEVRSRGLEIEARASLRNFDFVGALGWTDAEVTKSNQGTVGTRPVSVPRNMASLWVDYRASFLPGLIAGGGVRHIGKQEIIRFDVPSYTVFDVALRYELSHWRLALNVKNVFDKSYITACNFTCYYGDERNFTLTASYRW